MPARSPCLRRAGALPNAAAAYLHVCRSALLQGGPVELEYLDPADPSLAVHRLYGGSHRQRRRFGTEGASRLGGSPGAAPACLAAAHRSVLVRAAVCREMARRVT